MSASGYQVPPSLACRSTAQRQSGLCPDCPTSWVSPSTIIQLSHSSCACPFSDYAPKLAAATFLLTSSKVSNAGFPPPPPLPPVLAPDCPFFYPVPLGEVWFAFPQARPFPRGSKFSAHFRVAIAGASPFPASSWLELSLPCASVTLFSLTASVCCYLTSAYISYLSAVNPPPSSWIQLFHKTWFPVA